MQSLPLALAALLGIAHIIAAAQASNRHRGLRYNGGPRDTPQPPLPGVAGRLERAQRNFMETFPIFAALVVAAGVMGVSDWRVSWGAWLYLAARLAYVPLYALGVFLWRSIVWNVALVGIVLLLWAVALP